MKCPRCPFEDREGAKLCNENGHKLEIDCPSCGATNRAAGKFCDQRHHLQGPYQELKNNHENIATEEPCMHDLRQD
jgi:hypothetical protein